MRLLGYFLVEHFLAARSAGPATPLTRLFLFMAICPSEPLAISLDTIPVSVVGANHGAGGE